MQKETRPPCPFKDVAGRSLPYDVPGIGPQAGDVTYLEPTYAEVAGIIAARHWRHAETDRGLLANLIAWEEIKQDVAHLADPNHAGEWSEIMEGMDEDGAAECEILQKVAAILEKRTQRNAEWLAKHNPEIPATSS